ncbi:MAG: hypothetical protein INR69_04220 [Mucilaginibacter polytrichastri]|nr:hypothetical protein [Mucilaginibacter polytrichastri]
MRRIFIFSLLMLIGRLAYAQELYINTEPASNMAAKSLGIRVENQGFFNPGFKNRSTLELMAGLNRAWMVHGSAYMSDFYGRNQRLEGGSVYAKYRFLSVDSVQRHFRGAAFVKASLSDNHVMNQEINLEGDNSAVQAGVVFTQLLHKLALSSSLSYIRGFDNVGNAIPDGFARNVVAYTLSGGYLLLPKTYTDYDQLNFNLYFELLGKANPGRGQSYLDAAPGVQFIINSNTRIDLSFRTPLWSEMTRMTGNMYLVRLEYNLFNFL